jgi:hypothetical protein
MGIFIPKGEDGAGLTERQAFRREHGASPPI